MADFKQFRKVNGLTQENAAEYFSCTQGFISQIEKGIRPIPSEFISKAMANKSWDCAALTAESPAPETGSAAADNSAPGRMIPFYDVEAAAGAEYGMNMQPVSQPVGMIEIGSILRDSDSALRVYGNSMVPNYPAGCVVGLKRHSDSFIEPGTVYVVETADNRYIKRLYYNKEKTAFRCISDNTMKHDDGPMRGEFIYQEFEIPLQEVKRLFRVTGVIKRNIL